MSWEQPYDRAMAPPANSHMREPGSHFSAPPSQHLDYNFTRDPEPKSPRKAVCKFLALHNRLLF